ncbi:putative mitochondrial hypothetical protein [Leptomonas pyrrhocoris]|uniref:Uncharacterized protein n=1 Tax=Leptomonas pyrrhocoris TaxID=157538 RepID=A0A0N0DSC2_LEPPY|nr:putative mitochondrial hypothetical protein [Leptomonas pyrrhocoris]KPA75888.1 putative mitochondrial hypothetical protein [Leptomonas pyrrhocoris]|eukprot:XP_015654327.1 putative mitochondrial hypothetical protein [Leptomonas pyrrhocoris]
MEAAAPLAGPTAPHSRTASKTTIISANFTSVGEANLVTAAANAVAGEKPVPLHDSTPRRRPSFMDPQQQPTPRGSLQWPSSHRSFSSAAATRDSSRHSQATDRVNAGGGFNVSATASVRGRAPSSTCHTPMSSRDDQSDNRASALSGAGRTGTRCGRSLGALPTAPPLVDVGDSPSQGPQSASHSLYTTGFCTPRDSATAPGHGRHPSPFSGHSISATVSIGAANLSTPAPPPPLDDFEGEAATLTRAVLEEKVDQMRGENLVLRTAVLRLREALATLQEGLRANYADIERRQDSIANMLLRRLEATKRHRAKLVAHLRNMELEKASQEKKLHDTKQSIKDLSKHLKREEQEIAERLQGRLQKLHTQREQLDRVLAEQTSSLQQLEQLVQEVEDMGLGEGTAEGGSSVMATTPSALTTADASTVSAVPAPAAAVPSLAHVGGGVLATTFHERSSSRVSGASSNTATTTAADAAYDPNAMIRYLREEIAAAESLRSDALSQADQYVATRERLERRLKREKEHKAEQESRAEALRQELKNASTAVNEKVASQETALEMELDRLLNSSRIGGDIISSASSTCATPKFRAVSAVASRGNSISPYIGGLATPAAAGAGAGGSVPGAGAGDDDMRALPQHPPDPFLLPSSGAPVSFAGHIDLAGPAIPSSAAACPIGMVIGDGAALRASSSIHMNTSLSRDETTASSEGTPHATRLLVQDTARMVAPRPVTSSESTPRRTPLTTPQLSTSHSPAA